MDKALSIRETLNPRVVQAGRSRTLSGLAAPTARHASVPEWTKGVACKAMIHGFKSRPALCLAGAVALPVGVDELKLRFGSPL